MWIRLRLDIGWFDLALGLAYCLTPGNWSIAAQQARESWNSQDDFLITLSVRSALDLILRALQLPPGSEVLLSALTVPDMVRIVQLHGLIPVPVDTDEAGNIDAVSLRRAISSDSRMVVVAHLFGGSAPLDDVLDIAHDRKLLVVEDCAQSFRRVGDSGHAASDVAMFSFGPIKTASALGGAVARVKSPELRQRMAELLKGDPIQSRTSFAIRLARFTALKLLSGKRVASHTPNRIPVGYTLFLFATPSPYAIVFVRRDSTRHARQGWRSCLPPTSREFQRQHPPVGNASCSCRGIPICRMMPSTKWRRSFDIATSEPVGTRHRRAIG